MKVARTVVLGVTFLIGCAVGGASSQFVAPPARAQGVQRWEYHCFFANEDITKNANRMGAEGWEMVTGAGAGAGDGILKEMQFVWCFKRPL